MSFVGSVPPAAEAWQDDIFYGAHYMNGCNPDTIKRCTGIPSKFPVTQELVGNLLDDGDTLKKAILVWELKSLWPVYFVVAFSYSIYLFLGSRSISGLLTIEKKIMV